MSPTIIREGPYRFYFFSREESRIQPEIELAEVYGLPEREITKLVTIIRNSRRRGSRR
jgi:hypothetical protein